MRGCQVDNGFLPEVDVLGGNKTSPASSIALQIRLSYLTPFRELSTLFWCQGEKKKITLFEKGHVDKI